MGWRRNAALGWALCGLLSLVTAAEKKAEKSNMEQVGYTDLQARSAYQPVDRLYWPSRRHSTQPAHRAGRA